MNRDSSNRKLSDSDFWQICHEMHPTTNYTFPVPPKLGVASNSDSNSSSVNDFEKILTDHSESEEASTSSDDSLQNLYVKKSRAHQKFRTAHANTVNTQKIYETIELFGDDDDEDESLEKNNDEKLLTPLDVDVDEDDNSINNADDLLLRIADDVQQLKMNVNQMTSELSRSGSLNALDGGNGDLIDFSDDWMNGESVKYSDKPTKKVMNTCIQGNKQKTFFLNAFFSCKFHLIMFTLLVADDGDAFTIIK